MMAVIQLLKNDEKDPSDQVGNWQKKSQKLFYILVSV